jgi:hypothetical protein
MGQALRDVDVRRAVYARLLARAAEHPDTLVIDELGVDHGACRIDIAVINGRIRGLEIKAEADTLTRLPIQVVAYGSVVDRASLIVAPRHLEAALMIIPGWWGVILADHSVRGSVVFRRVRPERANRRPDPLMLSRLLWRPEVVALLRDLGHPERVLREPREALYQRLVDSLPRPELASRVREMLKVREGWRDRPRPS